MSQVFFSRPKFIPSFLFKTLKPVGFQVIDMHFHTQYSMDAVSDIRSVIKKCEKRGIGVAVTDHNEIAGAVKAWKMRKKVFVIPGMEASTKEGVHTLFYFSAVSDCRQFFSDIVAPLKKKNPFFLPISAEELMMKAKGYNAFISAAHPFGPGVIGIKKIKTNLGKVLRCMGAVEGLNGANLRRMNKKAISWANHIGKGMTAGSDGHMTAELGTNLTLAYGHDIESFLMSVKQGYSVLLGKEQNMFLDLIRQIIKEKNYFKNARRQGLGMFWVKEHAREFQKLQAKMQKMKDFYGEYAAYHRGIKEKNHTYYIKLGENLFK